jgi:Protein of unknown function (DUF4233)
MTDAEDPAAGGAPEPGIDRADQSSGPSDGGGEHSGAEADDGAQQPRSGLRNPEAAVRGVGAGALVIEALVLLLAIVPLTKLDTRATGWAVASVVALCVVCVALAGLMRYRWAWYAGIAVQVLICFCGFFHPMLLAMGIIFGGIWAYVLSVRRSVLGSI